MSNHITEDNEDNDCFHDSLDRLLSSATCSSSSSCSVSEHEKDDDDTGGLIDSNCIPIPRFPMGVVDNYDVWISRPSSVDERRMRLLRRMGLSRDSSLFRRKHSLSSTSDQLQVLVSNSSNPSFTRSTHAGYQHFNCSNNSSTNSPVTDPVTVLKKSVSSNVDNPVVSVSVNGDLDSIPIANLDLETRNDGEVVETGCSDDAVCLIKNLDNGKEFVVDEVREDGMWGKLKEVGTERRLTMEEFEMCVGRSPIVQELMRRQNVEAGDRDLLEGNDGGNGSGLKKKSGWLKNIKSVASSVAGYRERRSSGDGDTSSEKGGRRSSSATDDSQDVSFHGPERVRVRQYGKSCKDLTALFKSQEIQAHSGSIWTIKFSLDGKYLASAGEDRVIHVWQVVSLERKGDLLFDKQEDGNLNGLSLLNGSPEPGLASPNSQVEKKKRGRLSIGRKSTSLDHIVVPETMFGLSEKPFCSFEGHLHDVLDLSWSKSQHLLSSSMDKTVRLWHLSNKSCLKIFSHNDYVTCIQFNPVDDRYFISGSLDAKVRIWSVPDHQVVDWNDMNEMVTAACYTPDGQAALVGSYKGNCCLYNTTENKLQQKSQINLRNKKTNSRHRKITGFQFAPGTTSEVLVTSADSRVRVVDGLDLVHKFKGFRNTNRQVSASVTSNGRYVVCASEDSHVYVWKHEGDARASRHKGVTVTHSYEHFHCQDVSIAIPWPGKTDTWGFQNGLSGEPNRLATDHFDDISAMNHPPTPEDQIGSSPFHGIITSASNGYFFDRFSATWPEEKLVSALKNPNKLTSADFTNGSSLSKSGWGMVIVTAGLHGEIRTFQNFGLPVRI
ncbi:putative transcription factor WD40-like family [Helianthus debilis subsp. tardiflorus]